MSNPDNTVIVMSVAAVVADSMFATDDFFRQTSQLTGRNGAAHGAGMFSRGVASTSGSENLCLIGDKAEQTSAELNNMGRWLGGSTLVEEALGESKVPANTP